MPWHQADGPSERTEELFSGIDQYISYGRHLAFRHILQRGVMAQAEVSPYHHGCITTESRLRFECLALGLGFWNPGHSIGAIGFLGDEFHAIPQLHFQKLDILEVDFVPARIHYGIG